MGADTFYEVATGAELSTAFDIAVEQASWEHGHGGLTGSLAEKTAYVLIPEEPRTEDDAILRADALMRDDDPRVNDKWGPAGALPLTPTQEGPR